SDDDDDDIDDERLRRFLSEVANFDPDTFSVILKCEVCGAQFETRRGLSSHARSHLRQLGIRVSESSGAPINLLYQIAKERNLDSQISSSLLEPLSAKNSSPSASQKDEELEDMDLDEKPIPPSILAKAAKAVPPSPSSTPTPSPGASPAQAHCGSPSSVVRKAPISSLLPVSSPLRSPEHKAGGIKSLTSNLSTPATITSTKPLWAPQENDAPLNLTLEVDPNKDIVCQLCGAWFETRKGLSSHARAHLRHFGVEYSESKGSPIDLLNQLIDTDDFKHKASVLQLDSPAEPQGLTTTLSSPKQSLLSLSSSSSSSSSSSLLYKVTTAGGGSTSKATSSSASSLLGPPAKRLKSSSMQVFRLSSGELMALPHSDGGCHQSAYANFLYTFCEKHRDSHHFSNFPGEPPKEIGCEFCGEYFENRKGLSSHARSHLRQMGITEWSVNGSPIDTLREIITRRGLPCALPLKPLKTPPPSSPGPPRSPLSTSSSSPSAVGRSGGYHTESLNSNWSSSDSVFPLNLAMTHEAEPTRDIRCEFCGEYFENRKGLSSHARSHLRQMGITEWSVNGSPIDTLREVMHKRGVGASALSDQGVKKESSHGASSPSWENPGLAGNPSCELCGFYFENRKALASHARAHLRQFGVTEWCVNGSPIETLSAWMRSRPQKVLEMHRSYMQGNRSALKKVMNISPLSMSTDSDHIRPISSQKASSSSTSQWSSSLARRDIWCMFTMLRRKLHFICFQQNKCIKSKSSRNVLVQLQLPSPLLVKGFERRPLKHPSYPDGTERESGPPKPLRTGTVPSLVPKPPSYPLVKLVGKFYTLKCRFCEVEFHGPLSVQEDWIRHLQQHILKMNYNKPAAPKAVSADPPASAEDPAPVQATSAAPASTSTSMLLRRSVSPPKSPLSPKHL
uniref:C2H2-type domain-containing protein n=1 Tax=Sphaeramia orbicularis TaxID=375764 RepID=A0A673CTL8_9TELE